MNMSLFWLIALILFGVLEAVTVGLTSIWFAVGPWPLSWPVPQTRRCWCRSSSSWRCRSSPCCWSAPWRRRRQRPAGGHQCRPGHRQGGRGHPEDRQPGGAGTGLRVRAVWTARSQEEQVIPVGERVRVLRIEGVKVYVTPSIRPGRAV